MAVATHALTVDLADVFGGDPAGVTVAVKLASPRLIHPVGNPSETVVPSTATKQTDADGVAVFDLAPSSAVGDYVVNIGAFKRTITMPASDARLSELMDA